MKVFNGRLNRTGFFTAFFIYLIICYFVFIVTSQPVYIIYYAKFLLDLLLLPFCVRRFHDLGVTGWFAFVILLPVPIVSIILCTALLFQQGENKTNNYGPPIR